MRRLERDRLRFEHAALNTALDHDHVVITERSPFDLLPVGAEEGNGRPHGTSIERFVTGAARLDRTAIERSLAA